jgi:hypothetical protein
MLLYLSRSHPAILSKEDKMSQSTNSTPDTGNSEIVSKTDAGADVITDTGNTENISDNPAA